MSLDIELISLNGDRYHHINITHNLSSMAAQIPGLYELVWYAEINKKKVKNCDKMVAPLRYKIEKLKKTDLSAFEAENKWGTQKQFIEFLEKYLKYCENNPSATIAFNR